MAHRRGRLTDEERRTLFLDTLSDGGHISNAAKAAGLPRRTVYNWRKTDDTFRDAWDEALDLGTDALEDEAIRRALYGVEKPVYQGGKKVGMVQEYSDGLMQFLLKGRRPEKYKDRVEQTAKTTLTLDWDALIGRPKETPGDAFERRINSHRNGTNGKH